MNRSATSPPGPKGHWLLGSLPEFGQDMLGFFSRCARDHGDIVQFRLAHRRAFLLNHPRYLEEVLVTRNQDYIKHRFFWNRARAVFGLGLVASDGALWASQRRFMQPFFQQERIQRYAQVVSRQAEACLSSCENGQAIDLRAAFARLTMGITAECLFAADLSPESVQTITERGDEITSLLAERLKHPLRIPDALPTPANLRYRRAVRDLDAVVHWLIEERRTRPPAGGPDVLGALLQATPGATKQLRDEVVTFLLAGFETTALALSWTASLLARHPAQAARVAEEARRAAERPDTGWEHLVYTRQAVMEGLRLYPPAYAIGREASTAHTLDHYTIPKGATVFMSQWLMHRDPRFFAAPDDFNPERWAREAAQRIPRLAYFPFGAGPRVCIGNSFALMELTLIIAAVLRNYTLTPASAQLPLPKAQVTLRPAQALKVRVTRR